MSRLDELFKGESLHPSVAACKRDSLPPSVAALLDKPRPPTHDALHALIVASPSLRDQCDALLFRLGPQLSDGYRAARRSATYGSYRGGFGALISSTERAAMSDTIVCPPDKSYPSSVAPPDAEKVPRTAHNLLDTKGIRAWPVRDQGSQKTCVAHAVAACIELMRATNGQPRRLSTRFLHQRMRSLRASGNRDPYCVVGPAAEEAKLCEAVDVLRVEGICPEDIWREPGGKLDDLPSPEAFAAAKELSPFETSVYKDYGVASQRDVGVARQIHAELAEGRPVAACMPGFRDRAWKEEDDLWLHPTTWNRPDSMASGIIPDPVGPEVLVRNSGHAVCIVGFQPEDTEATGGYFWFRNSWGSRFGENAPGSDLPRLFSGYGAISASYVEKYCWEWLSLKG